MGMAEIHVNALQRWARNRSALRHLGVGPDLRSGPSVCVCILVMPLPASRYLRCQPRVADQRWPPIRSALRHLKNRYGPDPRYKVPLASPRCAFPGVGVDVHFGHTLTCSSCNSHINPFPPRLTKTSHFVTDFSIWKLVYVWPIACILLICVCDVCGAD